MSRPKYYFEVYRDKKKHYRWRLLAKNKKIVADSAEGYVRRAHCLKMIDNITFFFNQSEKVLIYENDEVIDRL